jgi:hypothetical protein
MKKVQSLISRRLNIHYHRDNDHGNKNKKCIFYRKFSNEIDYQNEVGCGDVKYSRQRSPDVVEGHSDVLQAQVVEGDHGDENKGKRQNLELKNIVKIRASKTFLNIKNKITRPTST